MSKEFKTYSMDIAGKTLRVDIGRSSSTGKRRCIYALW